MRQSIFGKSIVGRSMEILLVEDDLEDARAMIRVLSDGKARCRVTLVRDGEEALDFILRRGIFAKAPKPDLILLDMLLPKKSGHEVLLEIQSEERLRSIPVVVLSVSSSYQAALEADSLTILDYIQKPITSDRFIPLIKSLHFSLLTRLLASSI